jgi:Outer membrane protein beta-barrel domain
MRLYRWLVLATLTATACSGQSWELGVAGGFGFYHDASITNPPLSAQAGFQSGAVASAEVGQDVWRYFGGELRYAYLWGDARLASGGQQATMGADAQAVHYDILAYFTPKGSKVRPYVSAGGGIKYYMANGSESALQPLGNFGFLTHANAVEGLFAAGAGIKAHIDEHWLVRVDFRYYLTPTPQQIFAPAAHSAVNGWLHNFVPMAGIAWTW